MWYLLVIFSAISFLALGWVIGQTSNAQTDLQWLASPLAILVSASVALLIASIGWSRSRKSEVVNRTISYLLKEFPLSREFRDYLGSGQQKIMESSSEFAVLDSDAGKLTFHIDIFEEQTAKLTGEEREALEHMAGVFEAICLNVKHGYFDKGIVERHLGINYAVQFWIRSWPFIVYSNRINELYMSAKGLADSKSDGVYTCLTERVLKLKMLDRKYPLYGERASEKVNF